MVYLQASLTCFYFKPLLHYFKPLLQYILCLPTVTEITQHKFEMARVLLSKCFSEADGTTFAHVNFIATPQQSTSHLAKRSFFAELMLIPDLQAYEGTEPMRVCTIDDSCFGK
jgi:hypothetical protein